MRKRVIKTDKGNYLYSNSYVKLDYMYQISLVDDFFRCANTFSTHNTDSLALMLDRLCKQEDKYNSKARSVHTNGHRYACLFTIMLGDLPTIDNIKKLSEAFINFIFHKEVPYAVNLIKKGKAYYIQICIIEREYNENGFVVERKARRDIFKSRKTGRICKPTDEDSYIAYQTGDVLATKTIYFSNKLKSLKTANLECFNALILRLKNWILNNLEKICKQKVEKAYSMPKIQKGKKAKAYYANTVNNGIVQLEKKADDFWYALEMTDCLDQNSAKQLTEFLERYVNYLKGEPYKIEVKHRKRNVSISFNKLRRHRSYKEFKKYLQNSINEVIELFDNESKELLAKLIPVSF